MDIESWVPIIVAVIAMLSGGYAILKQTQREREVRASLADTKQMAVAEKIMQAAGALVDRWEKRVGELEDVCDRFKTRIADLEDRVGCLEEENAELMRGAMRLQGQVVALGQVPVWTVESLRKQSPPPPGRVEG